MVVAQFLEGKQNGMSTNLMNGAQVVLECLTREKVEVIFGYPGGAVLPLYDALFSQPKLRHILVRHEQAAVCRDRDAEVHRPLDDDLLRGFVPG